MLLKKIILKKNAIVDLEKYVKDDVIFRRVVGKSPCFLEVNYGHPEFNDERCIFHERCPLKYTCSIINSKFPEGHSYIPTVL